MNPYDKLLTLVVGSQQDYEKAVKGNDSATRRVRQNMQDARDICLEIRMQLQAEKKSRKQLKIRTVQSNGGL
jgi:hypothetical protein